MWVFVAFSLSHNDRSSLSMNSMMSTQTTASGHECAGGVSCIPLRCLRTFAVIFHQTSQNALSYSLHWWQHVASRARVCSGWLIWLQEKSLNFSISCSFTSSAISSIRFFTVRADNGRLLKMVPHFHCHAYCWFNQFGSDCVRLHWLRNHFGYYIWCE